MVFYVVIVVVVMLIIVVFGGYYVFFLVYVEYVNVVLVVDYWNLCCGDW